MTVDVASWEGILVPLDGSVEALRSVAIGRRSGSMDLPWCGGPTPLLLAADRI